MPVVDVKNLTGETVGKLQLADDVFAAKVNQNLLHEAVRNYLAGQRAGTHKTKDKSEVSGSGKKLWRQKGTGRARIGSIRSPLWRHGGTVHGPVPRSYEYSLPKKMVLGALRSALSAKLAQQKLTIVDGFALETHKTEAFRETLTKLDGETKTILLVANGANVNLERASRNLDGVTLVASAGLLPYDLLRHEGLVLSREAAERLNRALSTGESVASGANESTVAPQQKTAAKKTAPSASDAKAEVKPVRTKSTTKAATEGTDKKPKAKSKPRAKKD